ncbi:winged helix-turn-helix domain-containing protein [Streptomyces sp. NPDC088762]|uniref:winged helix-turn-helix domain-containing protein n=1 Tax=Streptomyces sp. NPDC088762 TaxID=3365891 RepID=UPI00381240CA
MRGFAAGEKTVVIAKDLRVSVRSVESWRRAWREGGMEALRSAGPANSPTVTDAQFAVLEEELGKGPAAHGFDDERWTLVRVQAVISRRLRLSLSVATVSRLLKRHGWSWPRGTYLPPRPHTPHPRDTDQPTSRCLSRTSSSHQARPPRRWRRNSPATSATGTPSATPSPNSKTPSTSTTTSPAPSPSTPLTSTNARRPHQQPHPGTGNGASVL